MIIQALVNYYERESKRKESRIAPYGMEKKEIKFIIKIDKDGKFCGLEDLRSDGKKGKEFLVPKTEGRSGTNSWQTANLLWDHYGYVLGQPQIGKENIDASRQKDAFVARIESLSPELKEDPEVAAVIKFYQGDEIQKVLNHPEWPNCHKIAGCNLTFQLNTKDLPVTENEALQKEIATREAPEISDDGAENVVGTCLVTGKRGVICRTHSKVRLGGNQANLVGFQKNSGYDSYGKEQGYNAPISERAEFCYVEALKTLLDSDRNRTYLGGVDLLFWAAPKTLPEKAAEDVEKGVVRLMSGVSRNKKDDPNFGVDNVKNIFESIMTGKIPSDTGDRFYILGLSPNKARIRVVFWKNGSVKEIAQNICRFFDDIKIQKSPNSKEINIWDILASSEYQWKIENVPTNMKPALVYSVFNGTPYPSALFGHIMSRVRAERNPTPPRVAFIKAYLNRKYKNTKGVELKMALDKENKNPAYRMGRLFAVLEKIQEKANPGINATIRDRFYGAMSSSPASVFPNLMKLSNYHLGKLKIERKYYEKKIEDILSAVQPETMPKHLSLEEQGYFALGYYHQRQDLFTKKEN